MGVGPAALSLYVELASAGILRPGRMCEVGSQDLVPEGFDVGRLFAAFGVAAKPVADSSRSLMEALGFGYECIDKDGRHGALALDLNNTGLRWEGGFDVVTNHGTTEHIFDQRNCFRLIHEMTEPGGLMIHIVPCRGVHDGNTELGYGGHGLYLYSTGFFWDLTTANDYQQVHSSEWRDNAGALSVAVLRRMSGAPFQVPMQAIYR